jgi:hypothetical protein
MWATNTIWFDAALVLAIFAVGSILFGHFEEHKPKWLRLLKVAVVLGIALTLSATLGRTWMLVFLAIPSLGALYVHCWWLPKRGVNGWTGEPKERYYQVIHYKPPPSR